MVWLPLKWITRRFAQAHVLVSLGYVSISRPANLEKKHMTFYAEKKQSRTVYVVGWLTWLAPKPPCLKVAIKQWGSLGVNVNGLTSRLHRNLLTGSNGAGNTTQESLIRFPSGFAGFYGFEVVAHGNVTPICNSRRCNPLYLNNLLSIKLLF